jgi:gliding motility-associated-like protein
LAAGGTFTASNYNITYTSGNIIVGQAPLTIAADNKTKTQGSANPTLTVTITGFVAGDTQASLTTQPTITTTATSSSPIGSYPITASGAVDPNYNISYVQGTLTVTSGTNNLVFQSIAPQIYGTADFDPGATSSSSITYTSSNTAVATIVSGKIHIVGAGTSIITATSNGSSLQQTFIVTPASLSITADNQSRGYGAPNPVFTLTYSGFVNGETSANLSTQATGVTTATIKSRTGTYPITASGAADNNYIITYTAGTLTVTPVSVIVTVNNSVKNYGAIIPYLSATYTGLQNGDTPGNFSTQTTITTTATATSPVGTYPITASGAVDPNYLFTYVAGTLTVNRVGLTITANNQTKAKNMPNPVLTVSFSGFVAGDNQASLTTQPIVTTTATTHSPVGTYPITVNGAVDPNYSISYVPGTLTIVKPTLAFNPIPSKVYGVADFNAGAISNVPITYTSANQAVATIVSGNIHIVGVGSSVITATAGTLTQQQTLTVTRAPLVISAALINRPYGSINPTLTATYTGFVYGETSAILSSQPSLTTVANAKSRVGAYPINVSGASAANYAITYAAGTLNVIPVPLTVTANNATKNYGAAIPYLSATYSGFQNGDTPGNFSTQPTFSTAAASAPVGSYPITASGIVAPNYTITYIAGTLTINLIPLMIQANNATKVQGNINPTFDATFTGFVNGDTQTSLTTQPTFTTTAGTDSPIGTYPIVPGGAADPNYNITYVDGTLTITAQGASLISVNSDIPAVELLAREPVVHQAVSPNGDGVNDFLYIDNIENFQDNHVVLMNRAGNTIFDIKGYDNQYRVFEGHSNIDKTMQQPGTYFYVLEYKANGETKRKTGFFIIKY